MGRLFAFLGATMAAALLVPALARAEISVFACEPEWGALAGELGGDKVTVRDATSARQDPHFVRARPSLIAAVRRADLVICTGAELEIGWLPLLLRKGNNREVQPGRPGNLVAADYVDKLEVPLVLDRSLGDIHPQGNPHIHTDPRNVLLVARELAARLAAVDPANGDYYRNRLDDFRGRWSEATARWESLGASLRGRPVVVQHKSWVYLIDWLGLDVIVTIEPKPGIPPSPSHLETVLVTLKEKPAEVIIHAGYESPKPSQWLSERTGIPVVNLPYTVGGKDAPDLFALFDETLKLLLKAMP